MVLNLCLLSAILLGILYLFFGAFPLVFEGNHGFTLSQNGLTFIGILVGMVIGISCDPIWRKNYNRLVNNNGGVSEPEFRLPPTIMHVASASHDKVKRLADLLKQGCCTCADWPFRVSYHRIQE